LDEDDEAAVETETRAALRRAGATMYPVYSMSTTELYLFVDYRHTFYSSTRSKALSLNLAAIAERFSHHGYRLIIRQFSEVDFRSESFRGQWVLYQSSEDPGLLYKDYIEDVLLGLALRGARLVPDFIHFRAHHNKVFMEILRDCIPDSCVQSLHAHVYGTYEEFMQAHQTTDKPIVIKPAEGSRSRGVRLADNLDSQRLNAKRVSSSFSFCNWWWFARHIIFGSVYVRMSNNRRKFITQDFLPGLTHDYKVVIYGTKYYVLQRRNRLGDFRASGSGLLSFPFDLPNGLLDFAENVFLAFDVPFASLDIANHTDGFVLLEFQFVSFGQFAVEQSNWYFQRSTDTSDWVAIQRRSSAEEELADSVVQYVQRRGVVGQSLTTIGG
jgi:glutathione synthase/RimK-type ligase-like ATP-grasp enzyme